MAVFHRATLVPSETELISAWGPTQSWWPSHTGEIEPIGSYRFDDPDGRVGLETHLVRAGDVLLQVPLTYRDEPLPEATEGFITEMEHSALGTRWVYDGIHDHRMVLMLAAVSLTGQGEALGMISLDDRWLALPSNVRIRGGGWPAEPVDVDGFELVSDEGGEAVLRNDRFELTVFRQPVAGTQPAIGLTATWDAGVGSVVVTEVRERA